MLIDDIAIRVKAGDGGKGAVAFNKTKMNRGPAGANGGKGGSVYLEGVSDIGALNQFRYQKEIAAEDGENGKSQFNDGANAKDLILKVPVGTLVHNLTTGEDLEVVSLGQRLLLARGGKGGRGNFHFRSSTNTTPLNFEEGTKGEMYKIRMELKLIADVGFIGLPNVGKSSLLNELTHAKSRVANYPFTTLNPSLGVYYELILVDIPGLVQGASAGKGLGIKFLRHIERTRTLFHLISAESEDPIKDYRTIRSELGKYKEDLLQKDEYVFLTKADLLKPDDLKEKLSQLKKIGKEVIPISIIDEKSIKKVEEVLRKIIKRRLC
ncbi:MAG: GTPase ObgE [Candidatus Pacebacteria bacterium]|nr:GTPase ObgE [Candidatus Paceibacterota bacterium]